MENRNKVSVISRIRHSRGVKFNYQIYWDECEIMMKEKITEFYQNYYENEKEIQAEDNRLFEKAESSEEWVERLKKRSEEVIRTVYNQNMGAIEKVLMPIMEHPKQLTMEEADFLMPRSMISICISDVSL